MGTFQHNPEKQDMLVSSRGLFPQHQGCVSKSNKLPN